MYKTRTRWYIMVLSLNMYRQVVSFLKFHRAKILAPHPPPAPHHPPPHVPHPPAPAPATAPAGGG